MSVKVLQGAGIGASAGSHRAQEDRLVPAESPSAAFPTDLQKTGFTLSTRITPAGR